MSEIDFRKIVLAELKRQKWSRYKLAEAVKDRMSVSVVYGWLAGKNRLSDDKLAVICDELGMKIVNCKS